MPVLRFRPRPPRSNSASVASLLPGAFHLIPAAEFVRGVLNAFGVCIYGCSYQNWYNPHVIEPVLTVKFFKSPGGTEPVRDWLMDLGKADRKSVGEEIKTVQLGWPLGMPLVRKLVPHLWEIRIKLPNRIARVLFTLESSVMVLLHAFVKKSQAIPQEDLDVAKARLKQVRS